MTTNLRFYLLHNCENYRNIDFSVINKNRGNWVKVVIRSNSKTQRTTQINLTFNKHNFKVPHEKHEKVPKHFGNILNKLDVIAREQRSKVRACHHRLVFVHLRETGTITMTVP